MIQGIVCPWGWDALNNVTNVLLSCHGERDVFVEPDDMGRKLTPFCGRLVEVQGLLLRHKGVSMIKVLAFAEKT